MDEIQLLKVKAFDYLMLAEQYKKTCEEQHTLLLIIANKLGIQDMTNFDVTELPNLLDRTLGNQNGKN